MIIFISSCSGDVKNDDNHLIDCLDNLSQIEAIIESEKIFDEEVFVYRIIYESDGFEVVGYISAPLDYLDKEYPILIENRGGNRELGKIVPRGSANSLAGQGYIVLASQYRGVDGGTGVEEFGGAEINDVYKLIDFSEYFAFAKQGGVYMSGHSRGGMMTYIACRQDSRIKAAAVFAGISDCTASYYERSGTDMQSVYNELIGGSPEEFPEEYEKRSALCWADEIDVALLIIHGGDKDWRVLTSHGENMAKRLEEYGKEYKLIIYEDADHSLEGTDGIHEMNEWFKKHPITSND